MLQEKTQIRVSERTVQRARRTALARHPVHERIVKSLNVGEKQRRIDMANYLLNTNIHYILFSDEKPWELSNTGEVHWIRKGDPIPMREVKTIKASLMVWGCVWYNGKSELCVCDQRIDANYYINILTNYLLPCIPNFNRYQFQQDNPRVHTAKKVMNFLGAALKY
jgi:hypothetical protein